MSRLRRLASVTAALMVLSALATPVATATATSPSRGARPDLPPFARDKLAAIFDAKLAPLGLKTTRATLQNLDTYEHDPNGRHLAIYVEPTRPTSDARYVSNIVKSTRVFLPLVFERWHDLESFDVCQEPLPGVDDRPEPPPKTQILVSRKGAARVRWKQVSLSDLVIKAAQTTPSTNGLSDFYLYVDPQLQQQPAYRAALATAPSTSTTGAGSP